MRKSPFEDHWDKYEDWFKRNHWAYQSELLAIKGQLPKNGNGLEIGVGSGLFAGPLGIKTGVDPSPKMADLARKRGIEVFQSSAENLPFADLFFDFTLMVTTICFVDDVDVSLKEAHRVLKSDGRLIIGFVDKNSSLGKIYQEHKNESVFYKFAKFYSTTEVVAHLKNAGFKKFDFHQTIFKKLNDIYNIEPVRTGYGDGSFVVITVKKDKS